jgi:hypothetical protein
MNHAFRAVTLSTLLALLPHAVPQAAQRSSTSVSELLNGSHTAVVAQVEDVVPQWRENEHGDRIIVSKILLRVEEALKGSPDSAQWIDVPGGTLDGLTLSVSSLPTLKPGERAVFFLERRAPGAPFEPFMRGQGILKLDENNVVRGTSIALAAIRAVAQGAN